MKLSKEYSYQSNKDLRRINKDVEILGKYPKEPLTTRNKDSDGEKVLINHNLNL